MAKFSPHPPKLMEDVHHNRRSDERRRSDEPHSSPHFDRNSSGGVSPNIPRFVTAPNLDPTAANDGSFTNSGGLKSPRERPPPPDQRASLSASNKFRATVKLPDLPVLPPTDSTFLSSVAVQERVQTVLIFESRKATPGPVAFTQRTHQRALDEGERDALLVRGRQLPLEPRDVCA